MSTEEKTYCKAVTSSGNRCRNRATRAVVGAELDCCDVEQHAEKLRSGVGVGVVAPAAAAAPASAPGELRLEDLPLHEGPELEPVAAVESPIELEPDADLFGELEEPAAPAPGAAAASDLDGVNLADLCTPARVQEALELLSMKLELDGKKPLTRKEIEMGAPIFAQIGQRWFRTQGPANPYVLAVGWGALVLGSRYGVELRAAVAGVVRFVVNAVRRRRGMAPIEAPRTAAAAPASPAPAGDPAAPTHETKGWFS